MIDTTMDETGRSFLTQLFEQTQGDVSAQVSMYDIGESIGLDRTTASKTAEELIGLEMIEIRTLSGGIGITDAGVSEVKGLNAADTDQISDGLTLGSDPVLGDSIKEAVDQLVTTLKNDTGQLGLAFDQLTEYMADIKTIESQLTSSRPKTAIIRECFRSLQELLAATDAADSTARVKALLRE